jgi:hypothetical protein
LPNTHVGVPFQTGSVAVTNDATAGSEDLSATISTGNPSLLLPAGGTVTGIAAGGGIGYVSVGLATPAAPGTTSVTASVDYTSQPSGTSIGAGVVVVAGTAYEYAVASAPTNIDAGKIRRGSLAHGVFTPVPVLLRNLATDPVYGESLLATWSGSSGAALTSGSLGAALAPGQASSSLAVTVSGGSAAGIHLGSAALSLTSVEVAGSNLGNTPLAPLSINVSGTVYEPAAGSVDPGDRIIDFGHIRLGSGPRTKTITVSNVAPGGVFTEVLGATFGSTEAGVLASGTLVGIAAGVQDTTLEVGLANNLGTGSFQANDPYFYDLRFRPAVRECRCAGDHPARDGRCTGIRRRKHISRRGSGPRQWPLPDCLDSRHEPDGGRLRGDLDRDGAIRDREPDA